MVLLSVRQQLSLLLVLSGGIGLAVLAIATWEVNHGYVLDMASSRIETTARLKAVQLAFNVELMQTAASFVTTKDIMQLALRNYNDGSNTTIASFAAAQADLEVTLGNEGNIQSPLVLQAQVYSRNFSGPAAAHSVLNATGIGAEGVVLPWRNASGGIVHLGDPGLGYPPSLYPNLTLSDREIDDTQPPTYAAELNGTILDRGSTVILGPVLVNASFSLFSITLPILDNSNSSDIMGWLTAVADARLIQAVIDDTTGLGKTGQTLLLGPGGSVNLFPPGVLQSPESANTDVRYLFALNSSETDTHYNHTWGSSNLPFPARDYPAVAEVLSIDVRGAEESGYLLRTHNEQGQHVSVGYSTPPTPLVEWIVLVEQARSEVWAPIDEGRTLILACFFAVFLFMNLIAFPIAHFAVLPLRRLRAATETTIDDYQGGSDGSSASSERFGFRRSWAQLRRYGFIAFLKRKKAARLEMLIPGVSRDSREGSKRFRIPSKVMQRRHWVQDEFTALITTFNEMVDELRAQYASLDEKVRQRTIELDHSMKAAEAANESKTIFVANVSHELKTPLNGILGMCAISLEEDDDPKKLKRSLNIIHKSGDLLLRTLNDLLTFSTNQVGHNHLKLEEKEFTLREIETQVVSIFGDVAKERSIGLQVSIEEPADPGFRMKGKLRNDLLHGDVHRILQILINLVSNSLKFTPEGGSVFVSMRHKRQGDNLPPLQKQRSIPAGSRRTSIGTANFINPYARMNLARNDPDFSSPSERDIEPQFEVRDTGPGIPDGMQERIFEPFVQGDAALSRKHSGTGLGLSICSQLVSLLKGSIALQSSLGHGASFTVTVPLKHLGREAERSSLESVTRRSTRASGAVTVSPTTSVRRVNGAHMSGKKPAVTVTTEQVQPQGQQDELHNGSPNGSTRGTFHVDARLNGGPAVKPIDLGNDAVAHGKQPVACTPSEPAEHSINRDATANGVPKSPPSLRVANHIQMNGSTAPSLANGTGAGNTKSSQPTENDFSKLRVLVAEDNKVNQEVIRRMLKLEKITDIVIAEDGQQAFDLIRSALAEGGKVTDGVGLEPSSPYDLIFMDIQMPNMDGITATKHIRSHGFKGPIVALTAFAEQSNKDECIGCGMDDFMAKPIKRPLLKKMLTQYCSSPALTTCTGQDLAHAATAG